MKLLIILALFAVLFGISYLVTVGLVWLVLFLINGAFGLSLSFNVWLLGALVWVVCLALRLLFK